MVLSFQRPTACAVRRRMRMALALLLPAVLTLGGCAPAATENASPGQEGDAHTLIFEAMNTEMEFTVYGEGNLPAEAEAVVRGWDSRVSVTDPDSEIAALNRDGGGSVSAETAALLETALDLCRRTKGALDISIYPVVRAWGFTTGENQKEGFRVPTFDETDLLREQVDYTKIRLEGTAVSLDQGMEIDLGGVAKGYAGREAASYLRERGVRSALLNLGGNIQTVGAKPDGSPWRVAVRDPVSGGLAGVVEIVDQAAVTSGGYERYFTGEDGQIYWHIMDPATARPARSGLLSATVVAEDGAVCDGLSTALFVMGAERAEAFWRRNQDLHFGMVLITEEGEALVTPDLDFRLQPEASYTLRILDKAPG